MFVLLKSRPGSIVLRLIAMKHGQISGEGMKREIAKPSHLRSWNILFIGEMCLILLFNYFFVDKGD